jgi:hypothetical protein
MLLMDRMTSPGLLVRPRPGRLELCGEHVEGAHLRAVAAFAAGSAVVCAQAAQRRSRASVDLPAPLAVELAPAVGRHGLYVDRAAFGRDLYVRNRRTVLRLAAGGTITAQAHLEACWAAARAALAGGAAPEDLHAVDLLVAAHLPLPTEIEGAVPELGPVSFVHPGAWGSVVEPCARPGFIARPLVAMWHATVVELESDDRRAVACVPADRLDRFSHVLPTGALDDVVEGYLATAPSGRVLRASSQTSEPGLYDRVQSAGGLALAERDASGRLMRGSSGGGGGDGDRKRTQDRRGPRRVPRKTLSRAWLVTATVALIVAAAGRRRSAVDRGDDDDHERACGGRHRHGHGDPRRHLHDARRRRAVRCDRVRR